MARYYVDADKVIEHIRQYKNSNKKTFQQGINFAIKAACRALSDNRIVPRADVQEVKHGEWNKHLINGEPHEEEFYDYVYECSVCGGKEIGNVDDYCPYCGAKMDGGAR